MFFVVKVRLIIEMFTCSVSHQKTYTTGIVRSAISSKRDIVCAILYEFGEDKSRIVGENNQGKSELQQWGSRTTHRTHHHGPSRHPPQAPSS